MPSIPASQFGASFSGGEGFGRVMQLLGQFDWRGQLGASCTICTFHTVIPLTAIGGTASATAMTFVGGTAAPPTFITATVWGFPWRTGTVGAVAAHPSTFSPTTTSATGMDLRTAAGVGTLQLVTPFLIRVKSTPDGCAACEQRWYYGGTARAEFHFVLEAGATLLLGTGLLGLVALFRWSHRRGARQR